MPRSRSSTACRGTQVSQGWTTPEEPDPGRVRSGRWLPPEVRHSSAVTRAAQALEEETWAGSNLMDLMSWPRWSRSGRPGGSGAASVTTLLAGRHPAQRAAICGGQTCHLFGEGGAVAAELPFYYSPLNSFATPRKTWSLYLAPFSPGFSLDLIDYTRTAPIRVTQILAGLDAHFGKPPTHESSGL